MASFVGLKIQGIRSIGDNPHSINFLTPLTIIQGPNGTGKTTIIEALNYVTTGALPSGKMQTFIHNNEIANRQRVDALVQLVFTDIRGNKCTATKRMNASSTRGGKLTTKSDEFTLKIVDKFGNPKIISSKVADFNKEMITLLGVPKAVLEHVLFCHQEESNWPLSEPKELKLRFDAIFEVTKFVKALDNVKKNVKELKMQIQLVDKELPHLENNLRARADLILNCDQSRASLKQMGTTIDKLREEKKMLEGELVQVRTLVAKAQNANHEFEVLQGTINAHMHHIEGLANVDEFYAGSPEELELEISMLKQSAGIQEAENQHLTIAQEITSIRAQIEECKQAEQAFRDQQMKFDSRQMMMRNREQEYVNLLRQYSEKYEIPLSQNFVEQMQEKMDKIEAETSGFVQTEKKRAEELTERIEELRQKFAEHRNNDRTKRQEFFKLSQAITKAENEFRGAETASDAVGKLSAEIAKWEVQLRSMGDFKMLDAIWDSLQELQTQLNALRMDMLQLDGESFKQQSTAVLERANESLDKTLEHIGTLKQRVKITNQMADFKDRKAVASEKAIQLETFKQHLEEKKERLTEVETLLKSSAQALPVVEKELRELEAEKRAILEGIIKRERESAMDADSIDYAVTKINEIKTADARDKQANSSVENFREKMEEQRAEIQRLAEHQRLLESRLAGVEQKKHQLRLLEGQLKRMHIQKEVDQLQRKLEEAKENAQVDGVQNLAELKKKEHRLNQKTVEVNNQIYQKTGEQVQLRKKIEDLKKQLADPRYEGAKKDYLDKLVDRQIISATIDDLDNYYKVVDNAIIKFHQRKMEQINSILSELWSRVYQGNDIETIKIKSQPVSGAEKKKSYDYSVVMTVDQKDIDMRDRCSAGQKVLASILIRIALADVFAGNCRILALDEPTTNLDQDKVENIGSMLKSLIEVANPSAGSAIGARELSELDEDDFNSTVGDDGETTAQNDEPTTSEQQKGGGRLRSLQLIVITHDHRLVEHLYLACRPEYIYGLSKDENGVSRIIQHNQMGQTADLSMAT